MTGSWATSICPGWPTVVLWDSNDIMDTKKPWRQFKKLKKDSDVLQVAGMPPAVFSSFTELAGYPPWQVPVRRLFHCSLLKSSEQGAFFLPEASKYFTDTWCSWMRGRWGGWLEGWRWNEEAAIWEKWKGCEESLLILLCEAAKGTGSVPLISTVLF